jgi:hypothetical protein
VLNKNKLFLLLIVFLCNSCKIVQSPYESFVPQDYSFPVSGNVLEKNNIVSLLKRPIRNNKNIPSAGILLEGQINTPIQIETTSPFRTIKLKNQPDDTIYFLPPYKKQYLWNGIITIDNYKINANIDFNVFAQVNGIGKQFILTKASLEKTNFQFDDPFDVYDNNRNFPFLLGYVNISGKSYELYAVKDNSPNRIPYTKDVFYNPLQKFQIIDENQTVIIELENGIYTIYDCTNEEEKINFKYAIALLIAFRHSTSVLKNTDNNWDSPLFYNYVYP